MKRRLAQTPYKITQRQRFLGCSGSRLLAKPFGVSAAIPADVAAVAVTVNY
jgi:hypothetical protein